MADQEFKYDAFLSHASEDGDWCERLAERLRDEGVRVWFDQWEVKVGHNLLARINQGLKQSRKMIAVFSKNYFHDDKVWTRAESFAQQQSDLLATDRPLIPVLIEDCQIEPTLRGILSLDFRHPDDFDLRLRQLIEALDLPRPEFQPSDRDEFEFKEHKLDPSERGKRSHQKGKVFEDEVAAIYRLGGFEVKQDINLSGVPIDLMAEKDDFGVINKVIVECRDEVVGAAEGDQIPEQKRIAQQKLPSCRWVVVSSRNFTTDARAALEDAGVNCVTYREMLRRLLPLESYVDSLISDYEKDAETKWNGEDWFIRPDLLTDIIYEKRPALAHIAEWLGDPSRNQMVILGDLGTGKTTLSSFLAYNLARSFKEDPLRHPAPVLVPLGKVRRELTLESIIISYFSRLGLHDISFSRFEHLLRLGKIILFFDAFEEMADRVRWDVTQSNFRELSRAAQARGKVIITCRTHYFKDRAEQVKVIGEGPRLSEVETRLYRELRQRSGSEVVYLQEFDDDQIQDYLKKARPENPQKDWQKIQDIWNLKDLASRPLLLDMIVKSLPDLQAGQEVNAANLYNIYTNIWIDREEERGRKIRLDLQTKLALMLELAWRMWREEKQSVHYRELTPFVEKLAADHRIEIGDEEALDIANEMQFASFLKRDDTGNFSFIHPSFGEFFVARKLSDSAVDPKTLIELLDTRRYDQKTIYFLSQLDEKDELREPLRQILTGGYQPNISENTLQILYWTARHREGREQEIKDAGQLRDALAPRIPAGAKLAGANLNDIAIECVSLSGADLTGADLSSAKLNHARLDGSVLTGAKLNGAALENVSARDVDFRNADLKGASFSGAILTGSDFTGAQNKSNESFLNAVLTRTSGLSFIRLDLQGLLPIVQRGHGGEVRSVAYSRDGRLLASGGGDGLILIWRAEDGQLLRTLEGHTDYVLSVNFSPDGKLIASGSDDRTVRLWQSADGQLLRTLEGHTDSIWSVNFSPDGKLIASGSYDRTVRLWQSADGQLLRTLEGHTDSVRSVNFSPDGKLIASGSDDRTVRLWRSADGQLLRTLEGHKLAVLSVNFSPDGKLIASGSYDCTVRLWQSADGQLLRTLAGHTDSVWSVNFSPDGKLLASGSSDSTVRLWQSASGRLLRTLEGHTDSVWAINFSPDGKLIASGSSDRTARLWQSAGGQLLRTLEGHKLAVLSVNFSPDGKLLASGSDDRTVRLWQSADGQLLHTLEGHTAYVRSVNFSPDGKLLASGSYDRTVRLWQSADGQLLRTLEGHTDYVRSVNFSPDGKLIAIGSSDSAVRLWQSADGQLLRTLEGHTASVGSVNFSPDGKLIASGSYDCTVRLWQSADGQLLRTLEGHTDYVWSVNFSPDGKLLASGSSDRTVRLWQSADGRLLRTLEGHTASVRSINFSPDGKLLASGSSDRTVRLWQSASGQLLHVVEGDLGWIRAVAFAPNGRYLIAAGIKGRLAFIDVETGKVVLYSYDFGPGAWLLLLPDGRFDASPEGMRYLRYTEAFEAETEGVKRTQFNSYAAEDLVKEFYRSQDVAEVLAKYVK